MYFNVRDNFSNYTVCASFKRTFSIPVMLNFSFLVFLGPFAFSVFLLWHPIGGRDSLKKRNNQVFPWGIVFLPQTVVFYTFEVNLLLRGKNKDSSLRWALLPSQGRVRAQALVPLQAGRMGSYQDMLRRPPPRQEPLTPATARPLEPFGRWSKIFDQK